MKHPVMIAAVCLGMMAFSPTSTHSRPADYFVARSFTNSSGTLPYRLFVPKTYSATVKYPLILTMHGSGEDGTDNLKQITANRIAETWAEDSNQAKNPCFVVSPQINGNWANGMNWGIGLTTFSTVTNNVLITMGILDSLKREFSIDTNRIYVTGLSIGGAGAWDVCERYPTKFAAAVPLSGAGDTSKTTPLAHFPFWDFHGTTDNVVNVIGSRNMINALERRGRTAVRWLGKVDGSNSNVTATQLSDTITGGATLLYSEYSDGGHNAATWNASFDNPLLHKWLFKQSKGSKTAVGKAGAASPTKSTHGSVYRTQVLGSNCRVVRTGGPASGAAIDVYDIRGKLVERSMAHPAQ